MSDVKETNKLKLNLYLTDLKLKLLNLDLLVQHIKIAINIIKSVL